MAHETIVTPKCSLAAPLSLAARVYEDSYTQKYRNKFMRDRDRILYSKAFRRLAGKTQVYLAHFDEHMRTRLTHTLEVAQIAKTIATALNLDIDLTEAIALGHDIGHTPFGHAGESILHQLMTPKLLVNNKIAGKYIVRDSPMDTDAAAAIENLKKYAGFKHNHQSIRVAAELENIYERSGLNLTNFTLYGMLHHSNIVYRKDVPRNDFMGFYDNQQSLYALAETKRAWSFEAFVAAEADEIAQRHHDLEDAIRGHLITEKDIIALLHEYFEDLMTPSDKKNFRELNLADSYYFTTILSRLIVNLLVSRFIKSSAYNLNKLIDNYKLTKVKFTGFMQEAEETDMKRVISYDTDGGDAFGRKLDGFAEEINTRTISSYDIQRMDAKGQYIIRKIFDAFYNNPEQLTDRSIISYFYYEKSFGDKNAVNQIQKDKGIGYIRSQFCLKQNNADWECKAKLMRVVCDHISGMTDMYAIDTYERLYGRAY